MTYTRRDLAKLSLAALPASRLLANSVNSKFNGVQIGVIIPYSFHGMPGDAESLLKDMIDLGINACEMQSPPAEAFAGAPVRPAGGPGMPPPGGPRPQRRQLTPEQQAAQVKATEEMTKWRLAAPMSKFTELRRMYNDAGVQIYGFKLQPTLSMPDAEYDYAFNAAKALGANQLTMELPTDSALTARVGQFATKHKLMVGYHAHTQATPSLWDEAMSQSKYNGINLDIGHYVAGTSDSPIPLIQKHHDRITSVHLKDRKKNDGPNMPWGQGDTPIKEVLQLVKREHYSFPATIELEYAPPEGSDSAKEIAKCLQYAKDALA